MSALRAPSRNDYTGDGRPDLLWQNADGALVVWTMNGTTVLGARTIAAPGKSWDVSAHTDMNGDGTTDLLLSNAALVSTRGWLLQPGTGLVLTDAAFPIHSSTTGAAQYAGTGDVNLDGKGDLFFRSYSVSTSVVNGQTTVTRSDLGLYVSFLDGLTPARGIKLGVTGDSWSVKATTDLNADGVADVLWQNTDGTLVSWLLTPAAGVAATKTLGKTGAEWTINGTGDFNGDGVADLVFRNKDGRASVWLMDETGGVKAAKDIANPGNDWRIAQVEDLTGDGQADLVWMNTAGKVVVWEMAGTTINKAAEIADVGTAWTLIA